jgi:hypothetical protein
MHSIRIRSKIGKDGLLQVQIPQAIEGEELDIILVYEPTVKVAAINKPNTRFYGCINDDTFVRHPQGNQSEREPIE